ncbi:hypothetical protein G4Y73_00065 [Wenzhouxiangella sp. XN201]|uniref:hypothetical protein n=1 Tax=Wenzhouxiangella sp. XN201 TaxID=2710755 RepID=UPI0013CA3FBB|nr:hypothetical protein [Wenzhouxiangella sp. XN201]NEZ02537.1 hypothetical protein [Wenzhouxiangella sp. XN201]
MERRPIQIGESILEAYFSNEPIDGFPLTVETHSNHARKVGQKFYPRQLQGLRGEQFPEGVDLAIYEAKRGFRYVNAIWVKKLAGQCEISNSISLDFHSWDLPESLGSFIDRYVDALQSSELAIRVSSSKTEYGFDLISTIDVPGTSDIYSRLEQLESTQESLYRKELIPPTGGPIQKYGEERRHWWIRYVIVPLVGSGAVAAVLANYLLR